MSETGNIARACETCGELQFARPQTSADNCKCEGKDQRVLYTRVKGLKRNDR